MHLDPPQHDLIRVTPIALIRVGTLRRTARDRGLDAAVLAEGIMRAVAAMEGVRLLVVGRGLVGAIAEDLD